MVGSILSECRNRYPRFYHSILRARLEHGRAFGAKRGSGFNRRSPFKWSEPMANTAPGSLATNCAADCSGLVRGLSLVPVGRGVDDPRCAARRRDFGFTDIQPPPLRAQ